MRNVNYSTKNAKNKNMVQISRIFLLENVILETANKRVEMERETWTVRGK